MTKAELVWGKKTYVMGIINLTPDSFSGDGVMVSGDPIQQALAQAEEFIRDGADILDLGAESSRPGAQPVTAEEELGRLLPVLSEIKARGLPGLVSVDTWKAEVAEACLQAGADWINDIWGLRADARLAEVIARYKATVVLMHNRSQSAAVRDLGTLGSSYQGANYNDLIPDIKADLTASMRIAQDAGIEKECIILDPGIGFGKTVAQNLALINQLGRVQNAGLPAADRPVAQVLYRTDPGLAGGPARGRHGRRGGYRYRARGGYHPSAQREADGQSSENGGCHYTEIVFPSFYPLL